MTTILKAYTLSECMELMAQYASAYEQTGRKNLIFCEDRLTLVAERALVAGTGGTFLSSVTTFARYLGADRRILSKQGSVMAIGGIMTELQRKKALRCFTSAAGVVRDAKNVYETIAQMAASEITEETLKDSLAQLPGDLLGDKLSDLAEIYGEYTAYLRGRGFADESRYLALLPDRIRADGSLKEGNVFFLCYDSLTAQAAEAVRAAAECAANVVGIFCAGPEAIYTGRALAVFERTARETGSVRVYERGTPLEGDAEILRKGLYDPEKIGKGKKKTQNIRLFEAKDMSGETEYIAAEIRRLLARDPAMHYRDFAVLLSSPAAYSLPLRKAFGEYGIPCFFDEKKSLKRHPLGRFLLACFAVVREGYSPASVQALASNYFFGNSAAYRNYLLKFANYRGGARKEIKPEDFLADYNFDRAELEACRQRLLTATKNIPRKGQGRDYCEAIRKILAGFDTESRLAELEKKIEDEAEKEYLSRIGGALERLLEEAESVTGEREMTAAEFETVLADGLDATDISLIPLKADAVFVGDIADSRIEKVRVLFAAGMTEEVPRRSDDTALVSDREIERLKEVQTLLEPKIADVNLRNREAVCLNLCTFTDELFLSYPLAQDGSAPAISEIYRYVDGLFSDENGGRLKTEREVDFCWRCSAPAPAVRELLLKKRAFENGRADTRREYSSLYAALEKLSVREKDDYLQKWDGQVFIRRGEDLFFKNGKISPTGLEKYFGCPFCHFVQNGLKVRERDESAVMAVDSGNFIHSLLENTARKFGEIDTEEEARAYVRSEGEKLLRLPVYAIQSDTESGKYASGNLLREGEEVAAAVYRQIRGSEFRVEETEKEVSFGAFRGKIDRVDGTDKYVRIVDYKTGKIEVTPSLYYAGIKLQMELYMSAVRGKRIPAGVFYFPASLSYTDTEEGKFRMLGYFNGAEDALRAGDKFLKEGEASEFFEWKRNGKKGVQKMMDEGTFDNFLRYAVYVSSGGIRELKKGFIAPTPYKGECEYCRFGGLCGFNYDLSEARSEDKITPETIAEIARKAAEREAGR